MAFLTVEDKSATADVIVFPRTYQELKDLLIEGKPMLIAARVNVRDDEKSFVMEKAKYVDESKYGSKFDGITFRIRPTHTEDEIRQLKEFIASSTGDMPVKIIVNDGESNKTVVLEKQISMNGETKKWLRKF